MPEPSEDLDIVVTGFDVDRGRAEAGLMRVFGLDSVRARRFVEQLPVVAKRCSERAAAERYAHALRSIGARVELRPHRAAQGNVERTSLPAPAAQLGSLPGSGRNSSDQAIARFRASEGLDDLKRTPSGLDLYNPVIPKAPDLPHDLRQMPNGPRSGNPARSGPQPGKDARRSGSSDKPEWMVSDPLALTPDRDSDTPASLRPPQSDQVQVAPRSSNPAPRGERLSDRPRSVGLAHSARATGRPGLSAPRFSFGASLAPIRKRFARGIAIVAAILAAGLIWLRISGQLVSGDERHERAWRAQGIEPGEYAPARQWLAHDGHRVHGLDRAAVDQFFAKLDRAGAPEVFAIGIKPAQDGDFEEASGLLVEMPTDKAARRTLLWHLAATRGHPDAPLLDEGEPFQVLQMP